MKLNYLLNMLNEHLPHVTQTNLSTSQAFIWFES